MSSFKEFFYLSEAKPPKPPSTGKGARVTGSGLQIPDVDFPQMGYGYRSPSGPDSMTQWYQDYSLEQKKTELNKLVKAANTFQAVFVALNSEDPDEVEEHKNLYGKHVYTEGTLGMGAWIRSMTQSDGHGRGIMHRGIAKGYQLSAPEIEFLKGLEIIVPARDPIDEDILVDMNGDLIRHHLDKRGMGQNWSMYSLNRIDDILGRIVGVQGKVSRVGTNLDMNN